MSAGRHVLLFLVASMASGCDARAGDDATVDEAFRRFVAETSKKDCLAAESDAPNEALRQHLRRLCSCSEAKILATPMRRDEGDEVTGAKVDAADQACYEELGGAPGEGLEAKRGKARR